MRYLGISSKGPEEHDLGMILSLHDSINSSSKFCIKIINFSITQKGAYAALDSYWTPCPVKARFSGDRDSAEWKGGDSYCYVSKLSGWAALWTSQSSRIWLEIGDFARKGALRLVEPVSSSLRSPPRLLSGIWWE